MSLHWAELDWSATSEVIFNTWVPGIEGVLQGRGNCGWLLCRANFSQTVFNFSWLPVCCNWWNEVLAKIPHDATQRLVNPRSRSIGFPEKHESICIKQCQIINRSSSTTFYVITPAKELSTNHSIANLANFELLPKTCRFCALTFII